MRQFDSTEPGIRIEEQRFKPSKRRFILSDGTVLLSCPNVITAVYPVFKREFTRVVTVTNRDVIVGYGYDYFIDGQMFAFESEHEEHVKYERDRLINHVWR